MAPSIELIKASDGTGNANVATVQSTRAPAATTIDVDTVSGINAAGFAGTMGTPHTFTDPITSETITVISEATAVDFTGHVDGSNLEIDTIAPGYTDLGSEVGDIVIIRPTTQWSDNVAETLEVSHADDGTIRATSPKIITGINDTNGNELLKVTATTSAVNELTLANAATGNAPVLSATGGDTNIALKLAGKGTGAIQMFVNGVDQMGAWQAWIPTFTNLTVGNGTLACSYIQTGKTVLCRFSLTLGSTSAVGTFPNFSFPVTAASGYTLGEHLGGVRLGAAGTGFAGYFQYSTTTVCNLVSYDASAGTLKDQGITATVPGTWATGNTILGTFTYEAA